MHTIIETLQLVSLFADEYGITYIIDNPCREIFKSMSTRLGKKRCM